MKLTGKCREEFFKWLAFNHGIDENDFELGKIVFLNALIIEFFDSVGIYISLECKYKFFEIGIIGMKNNITISLLKNDTRLKATNEAILKANALFNQNK